MSGVSMNGLLRPGGRLTHFGCVVGLFALMSFAAGLGHAETIGIYADPYGSSCSISASFGVTYVYVIHETNGAVASEFIAPKPACWTEATWIGDQNPFGPCVGCGDSQTGITLGYGVCSSGAVPVLAIGYFVLGPSGVCCPYPVLPRPEASEILVADCDFNMATATGWVGMINGNASCPCPYPVPVEETTWGQVKALYAE